MSWHKVSQQLAAIGKASARELLLNAPRESAKVSRAIQIVLRMAQMLLPKCKKHPRATYLRAYAPKRLGCMFVVDNHRMKRALYLLLMVWITLQSTLVQSHMVEESLHQLSHTTQVADDAVADAEQDESCTVVTCSHPVGDIYLISKLCWGQLSCALPSTVLPLESAHAVDDIERPKWSNPAPRVAGI